MANASRAQRSNSLLWTSLAFTVLLVLISASFQSYFFLSPSATYPTLGFFQTLYTTTWFILVAAPPLILIIVPYGSTAVRVWLIAAAAVFPLAVIGDHIALTATYGSPYIDYLGTYPILLVSHLLVPAAYIVLFSRRAPKPAADIAWPAVVEPAPHDNNWQPTEEHHY
jgi:hypothetical protein